MSSIDFDQLNDKILYHPLLTKIDAIRVLNIFPGEFRKPLFAKLTVIPFIDKPKYIALSYTWETPYPNSTLIPQVSAEVADVDENRKSILQSLYKIR